MFIKEVYLENFRNYKNQTIQLNENVNVFYGNNAQGKTNILEALYFGAFGRSFRTNKEGELINFEDSASKINITYEKNDRLNKLDIALNKKEKKTIKLNGIKLSRNSELVGNINIVIFSPDDIIILKQGPSLRRKFLDILISQLKPKYLHELSEFNKILEQRNNLLKSKKLETIDIWNEQFAQKAEIIYKYRKKYVQKLQEKLEEIHPELTNEKESIKIKYITRFKSKEEFLEILNQNLNLDLLRGYTSEGPQREDFEILINDKSLNLYGSQGQHRTAILALKIAEMKIIEEEVSDSPILLLDDITSELDEHRIQAIFNSVNKYQVFITCTDINLILKYDCLTKNIKLYNIDSGKIV
ncbi:MAG: DNA replication/repair protein RecF [Clostridia bacterium]|nr:DNA replication/repair protein RecF [Clostridia bacterium]